MAADEQLKFTCRRLRRCREKLSADLLYRDENSGELYCKPGHCPKGEGDQQEALTQLQIENRRLRDQVRGQTSDQDRLLSKVESLQEQLATASTSTSSTNVPVPCSATRCGLCGCSVQPQK